MNQPPTEPAGLPDNADAAPAGPVDGSRAADPRQSVSASPPPESGHVCSLGHAVLLSNSRAFRLLLLFMFGLLGLAVYLTGRTYLETRAFDHAEIALGRTAVADPGNLAWVNDLGVAFLHQHRIDCALEIFEAVIDLNPHYAPAHFHRALCYLSRKDEAEAEQALDTFLRLQPNDARALQERAYLQASRGEYRESLESLQRAMSAAPDWAPLYIDAAAAAALWGRVDQAIRYLHAVEAVTSPNAVYRMVQQPAFRDLRHSDAGQEFKRRLAERAREKRTDDEPADGTELQQSKKTSPVAADAGRGRPQTR